MASKYISTRIYRVVIEWVFVAVVAALVASASIRSRGPKISAAYDSRVEATEMASVLMATWALNGSEFPSVHGWTVPTGIALDAWTAYDVVVLAVGIQNLTCNPTATREIVALDSLSGTLSSYLDVVLLVAGADSQATDYWAQRLSRAVDTPGFSTVATTDQVVADLLSVVRPPVWLEIRHGHIVSSFPATLGNDKLAWAFRAQLQRRLRTLPGNRRSEQQDDLPSGLDSLLFLPPGDGTSGWAPGPTRSTAHLLFMTDHSSEFFRPPITSLCG